MNRIHNIFLNKETKFENSTITKRYYTKLSKLRTGIIIIYILSLIISIAIFELEHSFNDLIFESENFEKINHFQDYLLIFNSVLAFNQIIIEVKIQKILIKYHINQGVSKLKCNLKNKNYLLPLIIVITISLIHPNYLCAHLDYFNISKKFTLYSYINNNFFFYSVNDILTFFGLTKIFITFYHYFGNLNYNSDIASRCW